jgi:NAD(P)-dependent dehydrogenase (short-subunit alcohol dehydrogenase family)
MQTLQGQTILVTGGGRGLGASICQLLAQDGAHVVVADINLTTAQQCSDQIQSLGGKSSAIALDVGDETQVQTSIERLRAQFDRIDGVVNNAGVDVTCSIEELSVGDWDRVLRTNLRGPFLTSKFVAPIMRKQRSGCIVNIASTASKRAWPNAAVYHASKWGLLGFSHALHAELRPHGIKVSAVVAGGMRTPFLLERFPDIDVNVLQDPMHVAVTVKFLFTTPRETVIPEIMVLPMTETSWP